MQIKMPIKYAYYIISIAVISAFILCTTAQAKEISYDRDKAVAYSATYNGAQNSGTSYNFSNYKCWNVDYQKCRVDNPHNTGHVDCANFASQSLIAGGLDFNVYDDKKPYAVTPINIGKGKRVIGFPSVTDLLAVLERSYCFERISDPLEMMKKAKRGDILSRVNYSHVVVFGGNGKYYGHTTDQNAATVSWTGKHGVVLYHFPDDSDSSKCIQFDGTIYTKLLTFPVIKQSSSSGPGNDHPDDNFSVATTSEADKSLFNKNAPIGILDNGFPSDMLKVLSLFNREARLVQIDGISSGVVAEMPLLIIPSGGLSGLSESQFFKASLDEYVRNGGTVVVLSQQHGYEYSAIPGGVGGYGWTEDQNCQANSSYIDTWHQILSGQTTATPSLNVDGYFTTVPANATVLLRRTANGQPDLITYPYGNGRIIATSVYTDFAYSFGQAGSEELSLIRDIVSWASKPAELQEVKPGESINQNLSITNGSDSITATAAWVEILAPDGKVIKSSFKVPLSLAPGQTIQIPISYFSSTADTPGIYHIKYSLFSERSILLTSEEEPDGVDTAVEFQLQAPSETDSGRFVVSNPPQTGTVKKDIWLTITSPNQEVFFNEPFLYTFHIYNNTPATRNLTLKTLLPHTGRTREYQVTATPNAETVISGTDLFIDRYMFETLRAYLYDENNVETGSYMLSFKGVFPAVEVTTSAGSGMYGRGQTVTLSVNLKNSRSASSAAKLGVIVTDPSNLVVYAGTQDVGLAANGTLSQTFSFPLSATAQGGLYTVSTEVTDASGNKIGGDTASFTIPERFVTVAPAIPAPLNPGANTVSFSLANIGTMPVSSGSLDATMKDPVSAAVASLNQPFTLDAGQIKKLNLPLAIPQLIFGDYTFTYKQSDESNTGKSTTITLANRVDISSAFDKPSYRIRETANLTVNLANSGRFNLENAMVTVTATDAGFTETRTVNLGQGQSQSLHYGLQLPDTLAVGPHTVDVVLTLQSGSSVTGSINFVVPRSLLAVSLDQTAYRAGSTVAPAIVNSGGVDTQTQCRLTLYDAKSSLIAVKDLTGTVPANGSLTVELPIPAGVTDGRYVLVVDFTDLKIGRTESVQKNLTISGVKAALSLSTNKQAYLSTESVTALGAIVNSDTALPAGNLHLQVVAAGGSQVKKSWTSQYDFQQGNRTGVDTFSLADSVTLTSFSDTFDSGFLNTDRWKVYASSAGGAAPTVVNGRLYVEVPNAGYWPASVADTVVPLEGDFDVQVDYQVDTSNNYYNGNNHPAGLTVYQNQTNGIYLWVDIWGVLGYGTCDSGYVCNNASNAKFTGKFRIRRTGDAYMAYYWNGSSWSTILTTNANSRGVGPAYVRLIANGVIGNVKTYFDNFTVTTQKYPSSGTLNLKYDSGRSDTWDKLAFSGDIPSGTSIKFRTRTAETESGLTSAAWSSYITVSDSPITSPKGRWIEIESTLLSADKTTTPVLREITVTQGHNPGDIVWQTDVPVNIVQSATSNLSNSIGAIGTAGKYYLQGTLTSSTGQNFATAEYPFFVAQGDTQLSFTSDKRIYKPGEAVTISGEVKNLATVEAANLTLNLAGKPVGGTDQPLFSATFTIPAGGSSPFSATTTAGEEGGFSLSGTVTQSASTLAQIVDQYEVASPKVAAAFTAPEIAGNDPFTSSLELKNNGKVEANIAIGKSFDQQSETVAIPAGQSRMLQYSRQINADTSDSLIFTGDLTQTLTKPIKYGPAVALTVTPQALYPEGKVSLPLTVTNSGLIDSQFTVNYQLNQGATNVSQQSKSYFLAKGASSSDSLSYDLPEGNYQLAATGQRPTASAVASFQVRKETKAELALSVGQSAGLLPATVNVTNLGYLPVEGSVRLALIANDGATAWTAVQEAVLPQALLPAPHSLAFSINLATLKPGSYTIKAELLDAGNRQLASQSAPFSLLGPAIAISQLPQDRTVPAGGSSDFIFKVKNSGNQEGTFDLSFKADDLINVTRSEWLKPGEEKELVFALQAATDLDEKDYFATYNLKSGSGVSEQGAVKYHLQGLNLAVTALLDRQAYNDGDSASFTLNVTQQDAGVAPNLFARVNYNGYNEKQSFMLNGSQTLVFNVPLTQITGEKLFYGIYTESGRSIHLNTIYVRKADAALAIATGKQVYNPGETVVAAISGTASGDLTLTGPGDFTTTFTYSGSDTKSIVLPQTMTAGTYTIKAQLKTPDSQLITASHPFDVAGIQVKVKEALLDKAKYAAIDTMRLNLTIESNRDIPATVKTWIVDPAGTYTEAGSGTAALTAAAPLLTTLNSQLSTTSLGIHKLVYGIYQGDLLLASGAKAFDVGEAVLLGLSTDKTDYPEVAMPVNVKVDLYGTTAAGIELFLDGQSINSDSVTLSGTSVHTFVIPAASVTPGLHTLKAVLNSGGLTSSRESRFTFGSTLPDLTARVAALPVSGSKMNLSVTVSNQGKAAAGESRAALFDGDPAKGGQQLAVLSVPAIAAGSSATLSFEWNILGKSGDHIHYAQADSDNSVIEFIETNNMAMTAVSLPSLTLGVTAGKSAYGANEAAALTVDIANLTAGLPLENSTLKLRLTSPAGLIIDLPERSIGMIPPATAMSLAEIWNSGITAPADITVTARLVSGAAELASATGSFAITPTVSLTGSIAPAVTEIPQESSLEALYAISNSGNVPIDGKLQAVIKDPQSGISKSFQEMPLQLPVGGSKSGTSTMPLAGLEIKGYDLLLGFISASSDISVARSQFTIKDTIPPVLTVSTLSDGSYTNQETLNVSGTVHDNSGTAQVEISGASVPVAADGSFSQALLLNKPDNSVEVKAIDMAGNKTVDSRTIHFDKTAPTLTIDAPADNSKTAVSPVEVKGSVDETSTVTVKLNGVIQPVIVDGNRFSGLIAPEPRWNTIEVTAADLAGNTGSQKRSVLFDDQKPSLSITEPDQDIRTNKNILTISGKASDPYSAVGVTVAIDGAVLTPPVVNDIFSQVVTFRDEKLYPITITASNEVGTQTTAQRNIIFDKTPPNLTIDPVSSPTNAAGQAVSGTREEGAIVVITCSTATAGAVEYPTATTWSAAISGLSLGENRIQAGTIDLAGNRAIATATILYVPKAPEVTINATPNQIWPPDKKLVAVAISGDVVTFGSEVKGVTISVADEYGKYNIQGLRFGDTIMLEAWRDGNDMSGRVYTVTAVVTDMAGNITTKSTTVIVPHDKGK